jgi:hypothetical protein
VQTLGLQPHLHAIGGQVNPLNQRRTIRACSAGKSSSHNGAKSGDGSNHLALGRVAITPMQKVGASVAACPSTRLLGILAVLRFLVTLRRRQRTFPDADTVPCHGLRTAPSCSQAQPSDIYLAAGVEKRSQSCC